ncbi:MAG: DUF983 domain-containing protein [Elioraea sp.]|nr:DUF983 domain-containing protein [Elioraea sp.]
MPFLRAALLGRCPSCGKASIFDGVLAVRAACPSCGLDLRGHDAGDGPAVAGIFVLGVVIVVAALWVELAFAPPLWLHAVLWPVLSIPLALAVMRPAKAALIALQYRHRRREMQGG